MAYKVTDTVIVDQNRNLSSIGIATFAGPVLIGGGNSTGTASQPLQVLGTNGAYIGGNLGIGSTNPSSKLWVSGDIYNTGIHTAQVLSASKDPGTGIGTDFTNSLFGNGWRVSAPGSTTYYKLATLPPGGSGTTFDHLTINGILGAWTNGNQTPFEITFANRGAFNYKYISYGSVRSDVRIIGISTNSSVEIWAQHQASQFTKLVYNIANSIQAIVVSNPTSTTTAPTGTTVFDSSTVTPRFIINESDNVGIGTISPQGALQIGVGITFTSSGNATFAGIVTANSFRGDGSSLTGVSGGVSISTNTTNANQLIPFVVSTGSTTGFGATTLLVYNPSSGNLGIGTTNPGATLNVVPTASSIAGLFSGTTSSDMVRITQLGSGNALVVEDSANPDSSPFVVTGIGSVGIGTASPAFTADIAGDARVTSTNKMRFGGTAGTTNFYIQYNSTANSLDFVAG